MADPDQMPSLAGLRRGAKARRAPAGPPSARPDEYPMLSLFDLMERDTLPAVLSAEETLEAKTNTPSLSQAIPPAAPKTAIPVVPQAGESRVPLPESPPRPHVWSVAALVREVRGLVERSYGQVTVEGEISNWRPAASGHCYFTLKDGEAQLAAVMFRRSASLLRFKPKDGDAVRLRGQISIYENRGQMQLIADSMELAGQGALLAAVQRLKEKLRGEGLFDRKRPMPAFPKCIGVVTSLQGAALRDIVKVCRRRHAAVNLLIYPAAVQGARCAAEVIAGLRWFSLHRERVDVVIVARGGGSWEDLHGFDDEGVARAIAACAVPVITGIGHATDTTIADAAADVCAPTPSAAAELVTAAQHRVEERVDRLHARMLRAGRYEVLRARQRLWNAGIETGLRHMRDTLRRREQRLDELGFRLEAARAHMLQMRREQLESLTKRLQRQDVTLRLAADKQRLQRLQFRLQTAGSAVIGQRRKGIDSCASRLEALSPLRVLERGYALVFGQDGKLLRAAESANEGDLITARLAEGSLRAMVKKLESEYS